MSNAIILEKNREKRHYKNHQRVQQKQKKEHQLQIERLQKRQKRHQGVEGSAIDCDFVGGLALKDVFLCKVNKFVDIEKVKSNLNKRNIPFENVTKESHKNSFYTSFRITVKSEYFNTVVGSNIWPPGSYVRPYVHYRTNKTNKNG